MGEGTKAWGREQRREGGNKGVGEVTNGGVGKEEGEGSGLWNISQKMQSNLVNLRTQFIYLSAII